MDNENRPLSVGAFKSFVAAYNSAQEKNAEHQQKSLHWSIRTFIAVAIYTAVTALLFFVGFLTYDNEKTNVYYAQRGSIILNDITVVPLSLANVLIGDVVVPRWENAGNTPATGVTYNMSFQFSRDALPNGFTAVDTGTASAVSSLGAKETSTSTGFRAANGDPTYFPQACINDVIAGKYRYVYIWGWAKYHDILRPDQDRVTRICWRLHGLLNVKGDTLFNHVLCDEGNCQDGACDNYKLMHPPKLPAPEICQQTITIQSAPQAVIPPAPIPPGANPASPPK